MLHPDLATALPEISDDRLTWTFHLERGIRYAPPFDDVEITAPDIVRALEDRHPRHRHPGVRGDVRADRGCSRVRRWAGLDDRRPGDARPLHPAGPSDGITNDLGYRFALPATAPIPPSPTDSSARFGAAEGTMMATDASLPPAVPT